MKIRIQPTKLPDGTLPYPYWINDDGTVGRQDFWKGRPARLIEFSNHYQAGHMELPRFKFMLKPDLAIGKYPVFMDDKNEWYTADQIIESIWVKDE